MWQHLLERFVPLMDADVSPLDERDGLASSTGALVTSPIRPAETATPVSRVRAAYEGSISPLPS
jgi:hypothetical protein